MRYEFFQRLLAEIVNVVISGVVLGKSLLSNEL